MEIDYDALLLRATAPADAETVITLTQRAFEQNHAETGLYSYVYAETPQALAESNVPGGWRVLLLEHAGTPVGCVRLRWENPRRLVLGRLAIDPEWQGLGLGRWIIAAVEQFAARWGREWVGLGVLDASPRNRALYEQLGYEEFARQEMSSAPGNFYALMRKRVPPQPINQTTVRYEQIAADYAARHSALRAWARLALAAFTQALPAPARVLDLGCGPGRDTRMLRAAGYTVVACDATWAMLALVGAGPRVQADSRALPFGSATFDGVWASATLLHLPRTELVLAMLELERVLRPGGVLFLSLKVGHGEQANDGRLFAFYQPAELLRHLGGAGFTPLEHWVQPDERPNAPDWFMAVARRSPVQLEQPAAERTT